jgi:hypothetical protein
MFENLKMMNTKVNNLTLKVKKVEEELKNMRDEKEERKKRRAGSPSMGETSSNLSKVMMMTLVNGLAVSCSAAASESSRATE